MTINLTPDPTLDDSPTMTRTELRASGSLASIFALRMLGLFLVLPVFALEARKYPGGDDPVLIGLAMGIYGLTQGILQIPFGMASDRLGRKRVIIFGLLVFALGSLVAGGADTLMGVLAGRALQGAGAVSAAVTALLADLTRDVVRTKAMALVRTSSRVRSASKAVTAAEIAPAPCSARPATSQGTDGAQAASASGRSSTRMSRRAVAAPPCRARSNRRTPPRFTNRCTRTFWPTPNWHRCLTKSCRSPQTGRR